MNARQKKLYQKSPEALLEAILSMQKKLADNKELFADAPLSVEAEMGDGRYIQRANPDVQEYRALVRDFSSALKAYKDIVGKMDAPEVDSLGDIRARFRVAK